MGGGAGQFPALSGSGARRQAGLGAQDLISQFQGELAAEMGQFWVSIVNPGLLATIDPEDLGGYPRVRRDARACEHVAGVSGSRRSLDVSLDDFPTVSRQRAVAFAPPGRSCQAKQLRLTQGREGAKTRRFAGRQRLTRRETASGGGWRRHRALPCAFATWRLCVNRSVGIHGIATAR